MADTTPDLLRRDQMSIVIQFVSNNEMIHERLLRVMEAVNKTGVSMTNDIYNTLNSYDIDTSCGFRNFFHISNTTFD